MSVSGEILTRPAHADGRGPRNTMTPRSPAPSASGARNANASDGATGVSSARLAAALSEPDTSRSAYSHRVAAPDCTSVRYASHSRSMRADDRSAMAAEAANAVIAAENANAHRRLTPDLIASANASAVATT